MATVQPADLGMFDDIHALLRQFNNPRLGAAEWRGLFTYPWRNPCDPPGYVLLDGARVVGFLGTVFSERRIGERTERFCNVTSWIVLPGYRGESIRMVLPLLRLPECTITNFSPSATVTRIFEQLGFAYLDTHAFIFYPGLRSFRLLRERPYELITDRARIETLVSEADRTLFRHHRDFRCGHLLLYSRKTQSYCYLIYTTIIRNRLRFNHVQHVGDPELFLAHRENIGARLFFETGTPFLKVDCRLLGSPRSIAGSIRFRVTCPRMYKSTRLAPSEIDNLYSELLILNL
ncbi:MAG: hypothetical protein ACM3Q4_01195 [Acidobacteriota bacterium]